MNKAAMNGAQSFPNFYGAVFGMDEWAACRTSKGNLGNPPKSRSFARLPHKRMAFAGPQGRYAQDDTS